MLNELSLFTGIGGGILGSKLCGSRIIGYVEKDEYCQRQISQRITDGILDVAPIFTNIHSFIREGYAASYTGMADIISAGFPCQPFSKAGKQKKHRDKRNLFPETMEVVRIVRPDFVLLENVQGAFTCGYGFKILADLSEAGYNAQWRTLSAFEFGAHHIRKRIFLVAYADCIGWNANYFETGVACTTSYKQTEQQKDSQSELVRTDGGKLFPFPAAGVCRMADDDAVGVDRITAIGNAQLPQVVQYVHNKMILPYTTQLNK